MKVAWEGLIDAYFEQTLKFTIIKLCPIVWTFDPYTSIIQHANMIAYHSTHVHKKLNFASKAAGY